MNTRRPFKQSFYIAFFIASWLIGLSNVTERDSADQRFDLFF